VQRLFYVYAKQWWNDYLQIRPSHADRLVKIFAEDEEGKKQIVTNFVSPIRCMFASLAIAVVFSIADTANFRNHQQHGSSRVQNMLHGLFLC
jgi:hypothetical protein